MLIKLVFKILTGWMILEACHCIVGIKRKGLAGLEGTGPVA